MIIAAIFGQRGKSYRSEKVQRLYHAQDQFTAILEQGATPPIDAFPFLKYFPGKWRSWAKKIRGEQRSLYFSLLEETREAVAEGRKKDCFMASVLEGFGDWEDEHKAYFGGSLVSSIFHCVI